MSKVQVFKLLNGDEVIAELRDSEPADENVNLYNPLRVIQQTDLSNNDTQVMIVRWCAYSDDERVSIPKSMIVAPFNPGDDVLDYYHELVEEMVEERMMNQNEKLLEMEGGCEKVFKTAADWEQWMMLIHSTPAKTVH